MGIGYYLDKAFGVILTLSIFYYVISKFYNVISFIKRESKIKSTKTYIYRGIIKTKNRTYYDGDYKYFLSVYVPYINETPILESYRAYMNHNQGESIEIKLTKYYDKNGIFVKGNYDL